MKYIKLFEELNQKLHYVYRGSRSNKIDIHDNMFFSEDPSYARSIGGQYVNRFIIKVGNPLILENYNKLFREKGIYPLGQDLLTLHTSYIRDGYQSAIEHMYIQGFKEESYQFQKELETCDSIFGEDAGHNGTKIWYVKDKKNIMSI